MHLAICDDNVADRKQMERLLKRESDRRSATSGILYANSFGNAEALLANPMQYDAFYIDMCHTPDVTGQSVTAALLCRGIHVPIVLCCSEINYREIPIAGADEGQILYLDKPIRADALAESIDRALAVKAAAPSLIELRETKETVYVTEPEILYCIERDRYTEVFLTGGRTVQAVGTAENLFCAMESHPSFFVPSTKIILNARHITRLHFHKATMTDGAEFKIRRECLRYAKYAFEKYGDVSG